MAVAPVIESGSHAMASRHVTTPIATARPTGWLLNQAPDSSRPGSLDCTERQTAVIHFQSALVSRLAQLPGRKKYAMAAIKKSQQRQQASCSSEITADRFKKNGRSVFVHARRKRVDGPFTNEREE